MRVLLLLGLLALAQLNPIAYAQTTRLALCTASANGNYYAAGQDIRQAADRSMLDIIVTVTGGSMDNLERLSQRECDAAIVQIDAYLVYQERHAQNRLELKRPQYLYDEFVHMVCARDAELGRVQDLLDKPQDHAVLVGNPGSGSASTWRSFGLLESGYTSAPTRELGGKAAVESLLNGDTSCMMMVTGLNSPFAREVDGQGARLQLIEVDDPAFRKAKFAGDRIYARQAIPASTYPGLQGGEKVTTVSVGAMLVVREDWAAANPPAHEALVRAIQAAQPAIKKRVNSN